MLNYTGQKTKSEHELVRKGIYEFRLAAEWKQFGSDEPFISLSYIIRDDVDQDFKKRIVFGGIYKNKETREFPSGTINAILSTQKNPRISFEDYDDLIQYLNGLCFRAEVDIKQADPTRENSKDKNIITPCSHLPSLVEANGEATIVSSNLPDIQEDDLPF